MQVSKNLDPKIVMVLELAETLLRSWWTIIAGVCLGLAGSHLVLQQLPRIYEATTRVDAFAEGVPGDFIRLTVSDDTEVRLRTIQREMFDGPELLDAVAQKFGPSALGPDPEATRRRILAKHRLSYPPRSRFFFVKYQDDDPERAADMANLIAEVFLRSNARIRATLAGETTDAIARLVATRQEELREKEQAITDFKLAHPQETAEQLPANKARLDRLESELAENTRRLADVQNRLDSMEAQRSYGPLTDAPATGDAGEGVPLAESERILALEEELRALLLKYSENHPDVQAKQREIDELRSSAGGTKGEKPGDSSPESADSKPGLDLFDVRIRSVRIEAEQLEKERDELTREIALTKRWIDQTPSVEQRLEDLSKDLEVLRSQYREQRNKLETAESAQQLEEQQEGNQFDIVERAFPPSTPVSPNPLVVYGMGPVFGLALFMGPLLARRLIRPVLATETGFRALSPVPRLVSIPNIPGPETQRRLRRRRLRNIALAAVSVVASAVVVLLR